MCASLHAPLSFQVIGAVWHYCTYAVSCCGQNDPNIMSVYAVTDTGSEHVSVFWF